MLNIFRRRERLVRYLLGVILFLVCITMVITLIPGITGGGADPLSADVVAEVGGEKITTFDLQQNVMQLTRTNRVPSDMMWLYTPQVLDGMVLEKASAQQAKRLGLSVASSEVVERLRQDPNLFPQGTFVGQEQYEAMVYDRLGMGVPQFEERFRQGLLVEKLRNLVTDSITVTPEEIRQAFQNDNEQVVFNYALLDPAEFKKDVKPADPALQEYFQKNKDRYQVPEKRSAKILLLDTQKVRQATSVPQADLKRYYDAHLDDYRVEERVQVSHILLKAQGTDAAAVERAKKKAADLVQKLKQGADFAKLAKENSEDTGSSPKGGDLGWIVRKQTVPEFEKAAFSLSPGTIGDPVQTVYGIHVLKVQAHEQARLKPLEEVRAEIEKTLREEKVQATLAREAEEAAAELRTTPGNIDAIAEKYHAVVLAHPPFARDDIVPGIGQSPEFQLQVFGLEKGKVSPPVPVSGSYAIALLVDVFPPHPAEFAEVKDHVSTDYINDQSRDKALTKANELAGLLEQQAKKDIKKAAQSLKLTVKPSGPLTRQGSIPQLGRVADFALRAFTMQPGETAGPIPVTAGQVVYQLESRVPPKEENLAAQTPALRERLLNEKREIAFNVFQDQLKSRMTASGDLKIHNDVLAKMSTANPNQPLPVGP
jgi:peptidyl-prolyl cis-trans isomerase D